MKALYASLHIKPSARAEAILFKDSPPGDSLAGALKGLASAGSAEEQALLIVGRKIPYTVAVGALKRVSPPVLAALISVMSPQEVINHLSALKQRGALDHPELRSLVDAKLDAARTDSRVSGLKEFT